MDKKTKSIAILVAVVASNVKHFPPWVNISIYMIISSVLWFLAIREFKRNKKFIPIYIICSIGTISAAIAEGIESYWSAYTKYLGGFDKTANIIGVLMLIIIIYLGLTDKREEVRKQAQSFLILLGFAAVAVIFLIVIYKYII